MEPSRSAATCLHVVTGAPPLLALGREPDEVAAAAVRIDGDAAPRRNVVQAAGRRSCRFETADRIAGSTNVRCRGHGVIVAGLGQANIGDRPRLVRGKYGVPARHASTTATRSSVLLVARPAPADAVGLVSLHRESLRACSS
jgi:hypothetical protein